MSSNNAPHTPDWSVTIFIAIIFALIYAALWVVYNAATL